MAYVRTYAGYQPSQQQASEVLVGDPHLVAYDVLLSIHKQSCFMTQSPKNSSKSHAVLSLSDEHTQSNTQTWVSLVASDWLVGQRSTTM